VLPEVPGVAPGLVAVSEVLVALLPVELAAPLCAGLAVAFSAELEEDAVAPVEAVVEGIAGAWVLLRAAHPASQEEATIVTTAAVRFPIDCIRWAHPSNWNASKGDKRDPPRLATKWPGINEM
jgi:predicted benzoate:H+ symporter BenE